MEEARCTWLEDIEIKYLNKQKGISNATVNLVMANATIESDK